MNILEEKIAALEEYCLNVDYTRFPVPKPLDYLFPGRPTAIRPIADNPPTFAYASAHPSPARIEPMVRQLDRLLTSGGNGTIK